MSRPGEAKLAKVKRSALYQRREYHQEILCGAFFQFGRLAGIHQAKRAFFDQILEGDAINEIDGIQ